MADSASTLPPKGADDVLYVIDLSGYVFRAYHALPPLTNTRGEPTHAVLGTLNMLNRMVEDQEPKFMAVAMEGLGKGFRKQLAPSYKANRPPAPADLKPQMVRCREVFEAYGVPIYSQDELEADDMIGALVKQARAAGMRVVVASMDKDLMQLVGDDVVLYDAMRRRVYGPPEVEAKFGVPPAQVRELLALVGDSSDNVAGVRGVGVKTAAKLLGQFGSIEAMYERLDEVKRPKQRESLGAAQDDVRTALELVSLRDDVAIEFDREALRYGGHDVPRLIELFTELEFQRFVELVGGGKGDAAPEPEHAEPSYRFVNDAAGLDALAKQIEDAGQVAVVALGAEGDAMRGPLIGLALATAPGDAVYVPLAHLTLTAPPQLSLDAIVATLGPLFANPAIAKLGHDLKHTQVVLARHGLTLEGARFDSMLASYLLDPESTHQLPTLARRDARVKWVDYDTLAPKRRGKPQMTLDQLDVEPSVPFAGQHVEAVTRLAERYGPALADGGLEGVQDELELPLSGILAGMEQVGVFVQREVLDDLGRAMAEELADLETRAHEAAGREFNLASPKQLEALLFDDLGLKSTRKTKTGRSTDREALEAIAADHPLPQLVLDHRAVAKLKGTYVDALPKLIHPETGRIHCRWQQAVAATGRLSSKDPNLQNIPIRTAHGKRIREAFQAPPGFLLLSADYSQIELRVLAHLSQDPVLVDAFNNEEDVHVRTAMEVFGVSKDDVTPTMRAQSKTVNFGVIYGMGAVALSKRLGISRAEAKGFIDAYFERYEGVRAFMDDTLAEAKQTREVRTLSGRRRMLHDLDSRSHATRSYAERIAQNTPIQGSAADLLKLAMVHFAKPPVEGARMVLTVHDELVFEVPEDRIDEATAKVKNGMESIMKLAVPLVVDVGHGGHWADAH